MQNRFIREAINGVTLKNGNTLILKRESGDFYLNNVYTFIPDFGPLDTLSSTIIDNNGSIHDTTSSRVGIFSDSSHQNIISTIYDLLRVGATIDDPIYPGTLQNIDAADTLKARLLITALVDLSLPHNSPVPDPNEVSQGIFTNYIQFMDNVVRNWSTIRAEGVGIPRLQKIHEKVLNWNEDIIIDPVYARNHGTLSEYGMAVQQQKRKNYAFYEGYSRMAVDLEMPHYGVDQNTGAGVMFRISNNIELYEANLADTFNMFGNAFLSGDVDCRRIIIPANDSLLKKFEGDGIWVKGNNATNGEKNYYCGMVAVRLSLQAGITGVINAPFALGNESKGMGDPEGMIVGDAEKSILKIYELHNNGKDTIKNTADPNNMLHRQSRRIELDTNYLKGNVSFKLQAGITDTGKMWLKDQVGCGITLIDTSTTFSPIKLLVRKLVNINNRLVPAAVFQAEITSRILALPNGSEFKNSFDGRAYTSIDVEEFNLSTKDKFLPEYLRNSGTFTLNGTDRLKIHTTRHLGVSDIIYDANVNTTAQMNWETFKSTVTNGAIAHDSLWLEFKYGPDTKYDFFIKYQHNSNNKIKKEEWVSLDVGQDYTSRFNEIYNKIASLCDCKTEEEVDDCRFEANKITEKYFEMWGKRANQVDSWGIRNKRSQNLYSEHVKSGWMCFQWAYYTQFVNNMTNYTHFRTEWSSVADLIGEYFTIYHSWITISINGENEYMHLDPWAENRVMVFNDIEHESSSGYGKRNFIGLTNLNRGDVSGIYYTDEGDEINVHYKEFWGEW